MDFEGDSDHLVAAVMERARSFSYTSPSLTADDYYALFGDLRVMCPVARNEAIDGGGYIVARYEDASQCVRDPRFSSAVTRYPGEPKQFPLGEDPPTHTDARRNLNPPFSPANIRKLESELTARAIAYLEPIAARAEGELVREFTEPFPCVSFMLLLGAPVEDLDQLIEWKNLLFAASNGHEDQRGEVLETELARMEAYFVSLLEEREELAPEERPRDLLTAVVEAAMSDRPMTRSEMVRFCRSLMVAGLDTVTGMLGRMLTFLAESPPHRSELLAEPSLIPNAVEEMLRYFTTITTFRHAKEDIEVGGVVIHTGTQVEVSLPSAGRDETTYPDAAMVDFHRRHVRHLAFGGGPHRCLGSHLARMELVIGLNCFLAMIPHFELDSRYPPPRLPLRRILTPDAIHIVTPSSAVHS
jgi:cytochrome P450